MQIQTITNLRNYNNYQTKSCNMVKNYSTAPMAVDTFTPSVTFKGLYEAQQAIINDDAEALSREIESGLDVNSILDTDSKDPLIEYAGYKGSINCFRELRKYNVDMYAEDKHGFFCFCSACSNDYDNIVQELVNDSEYNINHQGTKNGWTGLMEACFCGNEEIVDIILKRGDVDLALTTKGGDTAEEIAREKGHDKIVEKLQAYVPGVDRRTAVTGANKVNQAAFDMKKIQEIIEKDDAEALRLEIEKGLDVNSVLNTDGKDPLIEYAGGKGSINCFRELRKHDVNMYAEDRLGNFCFSSACANGKNDIVQELVNDSEYNINYQNTYRWNGLMWACCWEKEDIVDIILQRPDVDLTLRDEFEQTAEGIAREEGYDKIVAKLQAYVPGVDRRTGVKEKVSNATQQNNNVETEQQIAERVLKTQMDAVKQQQAELAKREEAIAKKEANLENAIKTKAEEITANEKAKLAQERREAQDEKEAYENLINIEKQLIAEEVEAQKRAYEALSNNESDKLSENMGFGTQMLYVTKLLQKNTDKLSDSKPDTPEIITLALQDDNKHITENGLKFIKDIFSTTDTKFTTEDLKNAILSVKGEKGFLDWDKIVFFISALSWKGNTVKTVTQRVEKYAGKVRV